MRCYLCGRRLTRAAAMLPGVEGSHPPGPVGPTCARKAGLIVPTLFDRKRKPAGRRAARRDVRQAALELA